MKTASARIMVPATSANLGPGFDVLGLALNIYNSVEIQLQSEGFTVEVSGEGSRLLEKNGSKMLVDAARRVFSRAGFPASGFTIRQHNRIPLFRGLGSSAAAVAGGMAVANALLPVPLPPEEILRLATEMEGHPDNVTPALFGGFTAACRTGYGIRHVRIEPPAGLNVVVLVPCFTLPTKQSRALLPTHVPLEDAVFNLGHVALFVAALYTGNLTLLQDAMDDRLHQPYRSALIPGLNDVITAARAAGALSCALSGAGPAVIAFVNNDGDLVGESMRRAFAAHGVTARVILTGVGRCGALGDERLA